MRRIGSAVATGKPLLVGLTLVLLIFGLVGLAQADPVNLALTGTATQSSTYRPVPTPLGAGNAIDGSTDGDIYHGSVTHTLEQYQPWWRVDLLGVYELDQIVLWNRTDCCGYRLSNFNVSVLDSLNNTVWATDYFRGGEYPAPSLTIDLPANILGQIVQVRLNGSEYLSLAEVQVFGGTPSAVPEPSTIVLLGCALAGLVGMMRRQHCRG